ncbi:hypothetical protein [Actinacidiphila soli]|uniref:hypothetical protein n=1 Tax=Actinacidiphila soli TaxID=2487275 RepID=UPI0019D0FAB5|nr:hypothetical protein [Actinacidiphila soli]
MTHARDHQLNHWPTSQLPTSRLRKRLTTAGAHLAGGVPVLIVCAVAVVALVSGAGLSWLPLLAVGPALAAATSRPWGVLRIGVLAVALGALLSTRGGAGGHEQAIVLSALVAVALASGLASAERVRRERVLAAVRSDPRRPPLRAPLPRRRPPPRRRRPPPPPQADRGRRPGSRPAGGVRRRRAAVQGSQLTG